jgi:RNA polymerase sigma factor (sigma-70 family)
MTTTETPSRISHLGRRLIERPALPPERVKLVEDYIASVLRYADWFADHNPRIDRHVLHSAAAYGLWRAAANFQPREGQPMTVGFYAYAKMNARYELWRALRRAVTERNRNREFQVASDEGVTRVVAIDRCPRPDAEAELRDESRNLRHALRVLAGNPRNVVERFLAGETMTEIAAARGVTRERVRQLILAARDRIRKEFALQN